MENHAFSKFLIVPFLFFILFYFPPFYRRAPKLHYSASMPLSQLVVWQAIKSNFLSNLFVNLFFTLIGCFKIV